MKAIIVNSYGRSGSTLVVNALLDAVSENTSSTCFRKMIRYYRNRSAWNWTAKTKFRKKNIYKTHSRYIDQKRTLNVKCIYMYSDPIEVVASLDRLRLSHGTKWLSEHYKHLGLGFKGDSSLLGGDKLKLKEHIFGWLTQSEIEVLFVRYETLWENLSVLRDFTGLNLQLPPKEKRQKKARSITINLEKNDELTLLRATLADLPDTLIVNKE